MTITRFALVPIFVLASAARAQASLVPPPYVEYRADGIFGNAETVQGGVGLNVPMGIYVRLGVIGAAGVAHRDGDASFSGRTDVIARFLLDPLRETPVGLSLGGGVSVPYEQGMRVRPYLTAVIDVEGRRRGGISPALQVGLGGGTRVGVVLRASPERRR
jgi:hypothetical protein